MKGHHRITKNESALKHTFDLKKLLNLNVLSSKGKIIGKVSQLRIHPTKMNIEGIVVSRGIFRKPMYIGSSYIKRFSRASFLLDVEPAVLIKGKRVIDTHGRKVGKVKDLRRKEHSNSIQDIVVSSPLRKDLIIKTTDIKSIGEAIILKAHYHVKKQYFWKKSE